MLDDLKMIHERDKQDALGVAEKTPDQLLHDFAVNLSPQADAIKNIVVAGMGGSALAAEAFLSWPGVKRPFEICRSYQIPSYVDGDTLFIASSYSGNTEETLAAVAEAEQRGAGIIVICSGGALAQLAGDKGYPYLQIPAGYQPRHAVLFSLKAIVSITDALGLTDGAAAQLTQEAEWIRGQLGNWLPTIPTHNNLAKQLALETIGKSVVIYSSPVLWPAAYKWKISFNENAKHIAWANQLSEYNHNEFIGWTKQPTEKPYAVIELRSNLDLPQIQKRFAISERLLSGIRPAPEVVEVQGESWCQQLLWAITLGEFVSMYAALLANINPMPVDLLEKLKVELKTDDPA